MYWHISVNTGTASNKPLASMCTCHLWLPASDGNHYLWIRGGEVFLHRLKELSEGIFREDIIPCDTSPVAEVQVCDSQAWHTRRPATERGNLRWVYYRWVHYRCVYYGYVTHVILIFYWHYRYGRYMLMMSYWYTTHITEIILTHQLVSCLILSCLVAVLANTPMEYTAILDIKKYVLIQYPVPRIIQNDPLRPWCCSPVHTNTNLSWGQLNCNWN